MKPAAALPALALAAAMSAAFAADDIEIGRRIYQEGRLADGSPLVASRPEGGEVRGREAACATCHRRSGMGGGEGRLLVPPIIGPVLFAKPRPVWPTRMGRQPQKVIPLRYQSREAYDDANLLRALREGIDSSGRAFGNLMPRYALDEHAGRALAAYLRSLGATLPPGIEGSALHLATIIAPDAPEDRRKTVVETLGRWADAAPPGLTLRPHVWELAGPAETWGEQLDRFYRERPVYAVLSGAGAARWQPMHEFCERTALPCLFPVLDAAPEHIDGHYSMYFSAGVLLEARLMAHELKKRKGRIVQLHADESGRAAAARLADELPAIATESHHFDDTARLAALEELDPDDTLVAWLRPTELATLATSLPSGPGAGRVLLSAQLAPPAQTSLPPSWRPAVRWASARSAPQRLRGQTVLGLLPWLKRLQLPLDDEVIQSDVYGAIFFFLDAQARMLGRFDREFLLERLEMAVDNRPAGGAYYNLSLGPGQRQAAKGGYLLGYVAPQFEQLAPLGPRVVPE